MRFVETALLLGICKRQLKSAETSHTKIKMWRMFVQE